MLTSSSPLAALRLAARPSGLCWGSVQRRAFGIKTTLKVQEYISKAIKADKQGEKHVTGPQPVVDTIFANMPPELRVPLFPEPMRMDTMEHKWGTSDLEALDVGTTKHRIPDRISDKIALWAVKSARRPTDVFFRHKYVHRAVMLEVVAAVPGMVGALIRHVRSLQRMRHDGGWIGHLLHEAENERMHLMTWMEISKPVLWERALIATVQTGFFAVFSLLYMVSPRTAHRVVGYLEEEAVTSYTHFIGEIDAGRIANVPAPAVAIAYWNLEPTSTLRDVVLAVRADEALHRDTNHHFSDRIEARRESLFDDLDNSDNKPRIKY
ncbi:inducible alternative oxidase 2 [Coemansia thaxteri]|uniref:Alternative oxidase n=1 Tax=Coemansia thaxteri TaxID=2663907 RepID=A0A9W8BMP8_9FUNG|nr:inducible alternative oxidase 2 [Coemansia thaxteri]KAJ2006644.1 inducible alternative oxidase 2 [Coemansia thaxteri]KAJ2472270.1 inducible alternative oxidase 2 [Coemansia sp. RSA 2322]KAJ2483045.1 inducible alternative oxidase 2 [Coemansia sp. RSA 2320]